MITVTDQAANHQLRVRTERGLADSYVARIVRGSAGLGLAFAKKPAGDDLVVPASRVPVCVAAEVAPSLDGRIIDAATREGRTNLVVRSPKSTAPDTGAGSDESARTKRTPTAARAASAPPAADA
jgi:Fe-S cluster assembly iron-binding protein IscA